MLGKKNPKAKNSKNTTGVLITNLGSPEAPTRIAVRKYLKEFLSDKFVIEPPPSRFIWLIILNLVILNIRPAKSAKKYQAIWTDTTQKAPLIYMCEKLFEKIKKWQFPNNKNLEFSLGMRYGKPSIESAIEILRKKECNKIIVLPLYPQYSKTTTASTYFEVSKFLSKWTTKPELCFINDYHDNEVYIDTLASSIKAFQLINGKPDKLLISYHSVPERYIKKGDCYYDQCKKTTSLLAKKIGLKSDEYELCFQSVFGLDKWLGPNISDILKNLASNEGSYVQVICPGFPADCLETLKEIEMENKEIFIENGGQKYHYIPSLNDSNEHVSLLCNLIQKHI